uniref:Uncharacterized protein n=1 Tax=Plectus sambesii TaxID=2011161 RepID=A0A914VW50_9BILA
MELKSRWHETHFPKIISDDLFSHNQCDDISYPSSWSAARKSCNTACVTLHIQGVEVLDNWTLDKELGGNYTVRGCLDDLIGYDPGIGTTDQCFGGTIPTIERYGQTHNPLVQVKFCHQSYCNNDTDFAPNGQCNDKFHNGTLISCLLCDVTTMKCEHGFSCYGMYCVKTSINYPDGRYHMTQSCVPYSLYGNMSSRCEDIEYNNGTKYTNCYCRDAGICNGTCRNFSKSISLVIMLVLLIFLTQKYC